MFGSRSCLPACYEATCRVVLVSIAVNKHRLIERFGSMENVLLSSSARDYGLDRHDITNVRREVDRGTFRRHDKDAQSVQMLV
jgi:hypothetical protein